MQDDADMKDKKEYEISAVLTVEDAEGEIGKTLVALGAEITGKGVVSALKLAYPIKKHASGYFAYYWFSAFPEDVKKIKDAITLQPNVLRLLIVTPPLKPVVRERRAPMQQQPQAQKSAPAVERPMASVPTAPIAPEILSNELLEKKLEEILK